MNHLKIKKLLRPLVESILREAEMDDDVREVTLYAENDRRLYDILHNTYVPALQKFIKKGTFDEDKAITLLQYYWSNYVRPAYKKEFDDVKLNPKQRKQFAEYFLNSLKEDEYITY